MQINFAGPKIVSTEGAAARNLPGGPTRAMFGTEHIPGLADETR